ncbi:La- protein 7 [Aphanomyces cochlioides]|nr:La- protein 7 [Aphanomyces cochlioides]
MSTKKKVQKQMEFYLSPSNLRQDKFLQQQMQLDEEGFIPLDVFLTFNRMKSLGATKRMLTEAIEKSSLLVLNSAQTHVRPRELPDTTQDDSIERTIYIENFPRGSDHDSLRRLLSPFGKVNLVSMPRFHGSNKFKGFAFVEFAAVETVSTVLAALKSKDNHPELAGITGMAKVKWLQLRESLKERISHAAPQNATGTLKQAVEAASTPSSASFYTPKLLIRLSNVPMDISRKDIKAALERVAPVAFLDDSKLKIGGDIVYARYLSTSHTQRVLEYFKHESLQLNNAAINLDLVTGDEEEAYWTALVNHAKSGGAPTDKHGPARSTHERDHAKKPQPTSHIHFDDADGVGEEQPTSKRTKLN